MEKEIKMEKEYTHLDVRMVIKTGKLIHAGGYFARVPKARPVVDEDSVLVGLVCRFIGDEAFTVLIDDDETYEKWGNVYGQCWFPAGAIGHLYSFSKELVPKYTLDHPTNVLIRLSREEVCDLSTRTVSRLSDIISKSA